MLTVAVVGILAGDAVGKFVDVGFAREHGAGRAHGTHEGSVTGGRRAHLGEERGARKGGQVGDVEQVLGEVRHAGERAGRDTGGGEGRCQFFLR